MLLLHTSVRRVELDSIPDNLLHTALQIIVISTVTLDDFLLSAACLFLADQMPNPEGIFRPRGAADCCCFCSSSCADTLEADLGFAWLYRCAGMLLLALGEVWKD
jgi:hypothetical protein